MKETVYGYIRVSTEDQNEACQVYAMQEFGIVMENMVIETQSGKYFQRPRYRMLVERMHSGDVLVIKKYRPAGTQLQGDTGAVAYPDERERH